MYKPHDRMSRSKLCDLKKSPYYFWAKHIAKTVPDETTKAMDFGSLFHYAILEPEVFEKDVVTVNAASKKSVAYRQAKIEHPNKIIVTRTEKALIENMVDAYNNNSLAKSLHRLCDQFEQPIDFTYRDIEFRAYLDAFSKKENIVVDVKTVADSKNPDKFISDMQRYNYLEQVFLYSFAFEQLTNQTPDFYFISAAKKEPFEVQVLDASSFYDAGKERVDALIDYYLECKQRWGESIKLPWQDNSPVVLSVPSWLETSVELEFDEEDIA